MNQQQRDMLVDFIIRRHSEITTQQAYRMINYVYEEYHSGGLYEVMQYLTDVIYIFIGEYRTSAWELLTEIEGVE